MPQFARPSVDGDLGTWTNELAAAAAATSIDEVVADDADYAQSALTPVTDVMKVQLSTVVDPVSSTGHVLRWRRGKSPTSGGEQIDLTVSLYQGNPGVLIAEKAVTDIPGAYTDDDLTLSAAEADAITDYADLWIRVTANKP
jgi:hypothetical protein